MKSHSSIGLNKRFGKWIFDGKDQKGDWGDPSSGPKMQDGPPRDGDIFRTRLGDAAAIKCAKTRCGGETAAPAFAATAVLTPHGSKKNGRRDNTTAVTNK